MEQLTYEQKLKRAELAKADLEKQFGAGSVFTGTMDIQPVEFISTGNFGLDLELGVGGIPYARVAEIFGPEGLGKSLLCWGLTAACQRQEGLVLYVDSEHAADAVWAVKQGVIWPRLHISQPDSAEQALNIVRMAMASGAYDLIIVDSVAALTPQAELNGDIGDAHVSLLARLMSQSLRILTPLAQKTNTALVFTNQVRENINTMGMGPKTTTPGGRALRFYSSTRIELSRLEQIKNDKTGELLGNKIQAKILKNKVAPPFKIVKYDLLHGKGFNNEQMLLEYGKKFGAVMLSGAWYYGLDENGEKSKDPIGQGAANACEFLRTNPDYRTQLADRIKKMYTLKQGYFDVADELEDDIDEEPVV